MDMLDRCLAPGDLKIRSDGRTVFGLAVPFDQEARVNDGFGPYTEVFRFGAFAKTIAERGDRVKLLVNHDRQRLPIGRAITLREDRAGLYGEFRVSQTPEGDTALELVRDGVLDAFSVGFQPVPGKDRKSRNFVERIEVKLREVSTVAFPAYDGALIGGVRYDIDRDIDLAEWMRAVDERFESLLGTRDGQAAPVGALAAIEPPASTVEPTVPTPRFTSQAARRAAVILRELT